MVHKEDIIQYQDYRKIVNSIYEDEKSDIIGPLIYCDITKIKELFKILEHRTDEKFIVISAENDYGLTYQQYEPVYLDFYKAPYLIQGLRAEHGYGNITISPRCNLDKCNLNDKYSVKCYAHTFSTFNSIPNSVVRWYVVNNRIYDDPRIRTIPFGINQDSAETVHKISQENLVKDKLLYVNFQNYTLERDRVKEWLRTANLDWLTFRIEPNIPFEEYLRETARHKFVLCMPGNGLDTHRMWECLYLNSVPILIDNPLSRYYLSFLPCIMFGSPYAISEKYLSQLTLNMEFDNYDYLKFSSIKQGIFLDVENLC